LSSEADLDLVIELELGGDVDEMLVVHALDVFQ